jgi:hypothetical protein
MTLNARLGLAGYAKPHAAPDSYNQAERSIFMQAALDSTIESAGGLPPVEPPSGKFIAQLFFVPLLIVAVVLSLVLAFNWLVRSKQSPEEFLSRLDDPNPDIRWRGAQDLAQVLLRNENLALDPTFGLDIAERLHLALQSIRSEEKALAERLPQESKVEPIKERESLEPSRNQVLYLSACLGNLAVPIGGPVLAEMAVSQDGGDALAVFQRRRHALWALANLGKNLKRLRQLSPDRLETILASAEKETTSKQHHAPWATRTLEYLKGAHAGSIEALGVENALTQCAQDANPFLREIAALAINFWEGLPEENKRLEDVLTRLTYDDGHGEDLLDKFREEEDALAKFHREPSQSTSTVIGRPGLTVQYNAMVALARRGSDKARLGMLQEMLDEAKQKENFRLRRKNGQEVADDATATLTLVTALQAVAELHRKSPERDLSALYPAVDELARNPNIAVRTQAEQTRIALGRK